MVKRRPDLRKISFIAHSVGGLVARYVIGKLYKPPGKENAGDSSLNIFIDDSRGTICGLEPVNFITVATPHLGSRGNRQVYFTLSSEELLVQRTNGFKSVTFSIVYMKLSKKRLLTFGLFY